LKVRGMATRRVARSREPAEFAANDTIRQIMNESEGDAQPAPIADRDLKAKTRYPVRAEPAKGVGLAAPKHEITGQVRALIPQSATGCGCWARLHSILAARAATDEAEIARVRDDLATRDATVPMQPKTRWARRLHAPAGTTLTSTAEGRS